MDGQQRLSTIYQYITGSKEFIIKNILKFDDLTETQQTNFFDYLVVVRDLGRITDDSIIEIFKRINSVQYALNSMANPNTLYTLGSLLARHKRLLENKMTYSKILKYLVNLILVE